MLFSHFFNMGALFCTAKPPKCVTFCLYPCFRTGQNYNLYIVYTFISPIFYIILHFLLIFPEQPLFFFKYLTIIWHYF